MKKFKLNKKVLFASLAGVFGAAGIVAVAAACSDDSKQNNSGTTNQGTTGSSSSGTNNAGNYNSKLTDQEFYGRARDENPSSYHSTYKSLIEDGARHLGLIGFTNASPLASALESGKVLDQNTTVSLIDNKYYGSVGGERVASVTFKADQAGFLAGISAAYYLNANQDQFAKDGKLKWGGYVGDNYSSTTSFIQGFSFGVMWANEKLSDKEVAQEKNPSTKKTWINVEQATTNTGLISGDFSPSNEKAKSITNELISANANIILPVAGPQTGATAQIVRGSNSSAVVIGVDSAQELSDINYNREHNTEINGGKTILFSIIKRVDLAVKETTLKAKQGLALERKENDMYADSYKLGTHTVADLHEGTKVNNEYLVGVSNPAHKYLVEAVKLGKENSAATDYNSAIKELSSEEAFTLLSEDKSSSWDTYLDQAATKGAPRTIKSTVKERGLELQKLLGGNAFVYGDKVYEYTFEKSSYLTNEKTGSTGFKQYWDSNKDNKSALEKSVKIVLGNPSSVLRDKSFSQSAYEGLAKFYEENGILIPKL